MGSHYLFFEPKDAISFIDVFRPRQRQGQKRKPFDFSVQHEPRYGELVYFVMNDGQRQRVRGEARDAVPEQERPAICIVSNMVTADLVDFTSKALEPPVRTFRADFFSPVRRNHFAYASTYGTGRFAEEMKRKHQIQLEMVKFVDYQAGQPISEAIKGTFATYHLAQVTHDAFTPYQGRSLALIVPAKLIEE